MYITIIFIKVEHSKAKGPYSEAKFSDCHSEESKNYKTPCHLFTYASSIFYTSASCFRSPGGEI